MNKFFRFEAHIVAVLAMALLDVATLAIDAVHELAEGSRFRCDAWLEKDRASKTALEVVRSALFVVK